MGQIRAPFSPHMQEGQFDKFYHTKSYVRKTYKEAFQDLNREAAKQKLRAWAADLGYKKKSFGKFLNKKDGWLALERPVPIAFFDVMGLDRSVLDYVIELDQQRFQEELAKPYHPDHFMVRAMPTAYFQVDLPDGISFEEAVQMAQEYADENNKQTIIGIKGLKMIFMNPGQEPKEGTFPPKLKVEGGKYVFV